MIEHNMDLVWAGDHVVDMGPGSGDEGGRITIEGPPQEIALNPGASATARALAGYVGGGVKKEFIRRLRRWAQME